MTRPKKFWKYQLAGPVDYFSACVPLKEYIERALKECAWESAILGDHVDVLKWAVDDLFPELAYAMSGFPYWEGDIADGIYVFAIPTCEYPEMMRGYIWKQSNNGSTFVASPVELPWLKEDEVQK